MVLPIEVHGSAHEFEYLCARPLRAMRSLLSYQQDMAKAGASMYTFHLECPCFEQPAQPRRTEAIARLAAAVREAGMHAGVALRPSTPAEAVVPYLEAGDFDLVQSCSTVMLHASRSSPGRGRLLWAAPQCSTFCWHKRLWYWPAA